MKKTKRSLLMSVISLLLCFSMLLGSTFAWFTDSVTSGSNVIQSGNLDLDVQYTLDGENWKNLDGANDLFQKGLWEPGHTEVVALRIENKGSLALKYEANMNIIKETIGKNKEGGDIVLSEILTVSTLTQQANQVGDISVMLAFMGESALAYAAPVAFKAGNVLQSGDSNLLPGEAHYVIVKVDMAETVGNEANHDGVNKPSIEFGINVLATQTSNESDSFGSDYDKNATFDDFANTNILATETKTLVAGENSVEFDLSNEGLKIANVSVPADAILDPSKPVTVTFDGIEPQITGENIVGYAYDIKVTNLKSGLTGEQLVTVVVEAPNALAAMQAYHNGVLIEDAVYDEVAGTITFKTASFSPYDFTSKVVKVYDLTGLRAALQEDDTTAQLMANITVDLTKETGDARDPEHAYLSNGTPKYYNGVMINGKNVGLDLNGYNITAFCGEAYNSNSDVGALFFVGENGSLNITNTGAVETGFIKMASSIYAVWAPFESPSYVDIYGGAFIADSYAGDDIGTALDSNGNPDPVNGTMKNENTNRALIYAGFGGNMNVYGGYFLYNNTPNDTLDRNNGAFNAKDFYEGDIPLLTIHDGVMLINKEYRQNPANTSQPNGSYDNYSVKLAKWCEIVQTNRTVSFDGTDYNTWYCVTSKEPVSLTANGAQMYTVGDSPVVNSIVVTLKDGSTKTLTSGYTIGNVDMTTGGRKTANVSYTEDGVTINGTYTFMVKDDLNAIVATPKKSMYEVNYQISASDFNVSAIASDGTKGGISGYKISAVDMSTVGKKTVTITHTNNITGKVTQTTCEIEVVNTTILEGNNAHKQYWFDPFQFYLGNTTPLYYKNYTSAANDPFPSAAYPYLGEFPGGANGEQVTGFFNHFGECVHKSTDSTVNSPSEWYVEMGAGQYGLNITNAMPWTTIGVGFITGYDAPVVGVGYYIDGDKTTLEYSAPDYFKNLVQIDSGYQGFINQYGNEGIVAKTKFTLSRFEAGSTHTITWVVIFNDGVQKVTDWTVTMASSFGGESYKDTEKPNVNVIVLSGQSNAAGATVIDQNSINRFANTDYKNVYIQYKNVYTNDGINVYTKNQNEGFEKYTFGVGGYESNTFGPEAALAYHLATDPATKDQQWFIIKYTAPGTNLDLHWRQNANLSEKMMDYVEDCVEGLSAQGYDVQIRSFLWMQGENDALAESCANNYAVNEQNLVSAFRLKFAKYATRPNGSVPGSGISFITAGIAPKGKDGLALWEYSSKVNGAKVNNTAIWYVPGTLTEYSALYGLVEAPGMHLNPNGGAIYNSAYIDTSLMSTQAHDTAHYDQQSMDWLGTWFGQYVAALMAVYE